MSTPKIIKFAFFLLLWYLPFNLKAQKTFSINKVYLDSFDFRKYKSYLVSQNCEIDFIGRRIPVNKRFTPDSFQMGTTEKAIISQYYDARVRQLDSQWQQMKESKETYDWKLAKKQHRKNRPKMLTSFRKQQEEDLDNYDRYFYGYYNNIGEQIILIRFDPHLIKYFTIADEQHISNLPLLVYNISTKTLSLSGWE